MARWWREVVLVGLLGAAAGAIVPRVAVRGGSRVRRAPVTTVTSSAASTAPATAIPEISIDDFPDDSTAATADAATSSPTPVVLAVADAGSVHRARAHVARRPEAPRPTILTRQRGRWQLDVREFPRPRQVFSGVRLAPTGGETARDGYRITAGDRMGLLQAAGIHPGDVLVAVNGLHIRNPDDAIELLARSRGQRHFDLQFHRNGRNFTVPVDLLQRPQTADAR